MAVIATTTTTIVIVTVTTRVAELAVAIEKAALVIVGLPEIIVVIELYFELAITSFDELIEVITITFIVPIIMGAFITIAIIIIIKIKIIITTTAIAVVAITAIMDIAN